MQQVKSTARQNTFVASDAAVELLAGESQHYTETQSYKRNLVWQKHQHNTTKRVNYTPCEFDGPVLGESGKVKIVARSAYLQLLANDVISQRLKDQVEEGLEAKLAIHYLHSAYEQHCKKQQGPTAAAAALVALSIAFITYGTAGGWLGVGSSQAPAGAAAAGGATTTAGTSSMAASLGLTSTSTKIAAGIATSTTSLTINGAIVTGMIDAALCSTLTTISLNLANNGFDISKAVEALGKSENMRSLLTSMAVSGITAGFIEPLKQSKSGLDAVLQVEQTADLLTKVEHGLMKAGVQYSMSQLIEKGKHRTKFAAAMGGAIASSVADHLDFSICNKASMNKGIDVIAVKTSKAIIGGLGARVVGGKRAFLGGALGALVADLDVLAMNEEKLNPKDIARHAKATELLAGFGSLLLKQDVNAAAKSANRVAENKAYAQVLHNKLQDIALAKEAMLAKAKKFISSEEAAENDLINDLQKVNLEELLRDSGLSEEKIDELGELITEHNKAVIKATMQAEQNENQDLGVASEQSDPLPSDPNLPPPSDGSPNAQASSSSNTAPNTENQQVPPASRDKEDTTQQNNSNKSGLFFSRSAKGISNADNSASSSSAKPRTSSEQQTVDPQSVPENKQYSLVDIALQKSCKTLAGTLEPHVDRIDKFVEDHPYAMDAINLAFLTAAFSAGGIPGVVAVSLKSSIAVAGEEAAKDELVSRGVDVKDASIVVGAIALSIISPKGKPVSLEPVMPVTRSNDREKPSDHQRDKRSFATKVLDFFIPTAGADDLKTLGPEKSSSSSVQAQNIPSDIQEKQEAFELSLARAQLASEHPGANVSCTRTEAEGSVTDICRGTTSQKKDIVVGRQESSDGGLHYIYQSADRNERLIVHQNGDTEYQTTTHYFPKFSDERCFSGGDKVLDVVIPQAHADSQSSLPNSRNPELDVSLSDAMLIATGRSFVKLGQGIKQTGLEVGEKLGITEKGKVAAYTHEIAKEKSLYKETAVAQSTVGQVTEVVADIGLAVSVPGGAGATGTRLIAGSAASGALLGGIQATEDGSLETRAQNAAIGAAGGAVGGYVAGKVIDGVDKGVRTYKVYKQQGIRDGLRHGLYRNADQGGVMLHQFNAKDRIQHEALKTELRQQSSWVNPKEIVDTRLREVVDRHYRLKASTGSGSTADAVRREIITNESTIGKLHIEKAQNDIKFLEKWLSHNPSDKSRDVAVAENILKDLQDALGDKPWYSSTNVPR